MDELFSWLGAEVVDYPVKSHCCGGHMTQISEDAASRVNSTTAGQCLWSTRRRHDISACARMRQSRPMPYQGRASNHFNKDFQVPIIFFTQLLGVAPGIDMEKLAIGNEIVPAGPVIRQKLAAQANAPRHHFC
ncbi:MAG: hypothetical protein U5K37_05300 [Natrialbaceae archaeon]|nr:hypothetical protein [Natrialbaceae archaeon]